MLLSLKVNNFTTFKNGFEFSMEPGKVVKRFEDNAIKVGKRNISKIAVIAGENAGGKTSILRCLDYLRYLIVNDNNSKVIKSLCYGYDEDVIQKFELEVLIEGQVYKFKLEKDNTGNILEKFSVKNYNNKMNEFITILKSQRNSIDKDEGIVEFDCTVNEAYMSEELSKIIKSTPIEMDGLMLNKLYKLGVEIVKPFVDWITNKLIINIPDSHALNIYKSYEKNDRDKEIIKTDTFLEIFSMADPSIVNIIIDEEEPFEDTLIIRKRENGDEFKIKVKSESSGIRDFFAWSIEIWRVLYEDATLFADELDKVLNSILSVKILNYIKVLSTKGQFVFTTHNVLHINTRDFMKEQIYFVNKDSYTLESELYSLASFPEYRYDKPDVYELYLKGLLGGVPND